MLMSVRIPTLLALLLASMFKIVGAAAVKTPVPGQPVTETVRFVEDPALRTRWQLLRDPLHPGAPGRLVETPAGAIPPGAIPAGALHGTAKHDGSRQVGLQSKKAKPLVVAGDEVLLVSANSASHLMLRSKALSAGYAGDEIRVQLDVFHRQMRARVLAAGRAEMLVSTAGYERQP